VTVSLDSLDDESFRRMNDVDFPVADVLEGIQAAKEAGLGPIKINMVVKRGSNEQEILPMLRHFMGSGVVLRFIEYMDVGASNGWRLNEVLPSAELLALLRPHFELQALSATTQGETAERWLCREPGGSGRQLEIGLISSVSQAFCGDCNRARLSTEGKLYTCLFAHRGHDLRALLRGGADAAALDAALAALWGRRSDRYSQLRSQQQADASPTDAAGPRRVEMHYIGG